MEATTMRIRIPNQKVREKIVRRGMWNIAGVPMVVSHWSPVDDDSKTSFLPLWVHVSNVPMSMYSWEGLSFITSAAGEPDHLHPETIACKNFEVAKVFVKADLTKELPDKITYTIQGKETTVGFTYPWLPPKCTRCRRWGHFETFCRQNKKEEEVDKKLTDMVEKDDQKMGQSSESKEVVVELTPREKVGEDEVGEIEKERSVVAEKEELEEGQINGWEKVSSGKGGRSPSTQDLKYGQVTIATPSRYAILSDSDEKGNKIVSEEMEKEIDEELEIEEDQYQKMEESLEMKMKVNTRGRTRQTLPSQSKTNHRVVQERGSNNNL